MKTRLDEVTRMQQLAGIQLSESVIAERGMNTWLDMNKIIFESFSTGKTKKFNTAMEYHVVPRVINEIKRDFLSTLHENDYFELEERYLLGEFFKRYKHLNEVNTRRFIRGIETQQILLEVDVIGSVKKGLKAVGSAVKKGAQTVAGWFNSAIDKLKEFFGSVKEYVAGIWAKIKEAFAKFVEWGKGVAKDMVATMKGKVGPTVKKLFTDEKYRDEFFQEVKAIAGLGKWYTVGIVKAMLPIGEKVETKATEELSDFDPEVFNAEIPKGAEAQKESLDLKKEVFLFNAVTTKYIVENKKKVWSILNEEEASDKEETSDSKEKEGEEGHEGGHESGGWFEWLTKKGWAKNWKRYLGNIFRIALNPFFGTVSVAGSWILTNGLNWLSDWASRHGGPEKRTFHVTPEMVMAGLEISGILKGPYEEFMTKLISLIPFGIGPTLEKLWEFGHLALFVYAIWEVIKETLEAMGVPVDDYLKRGWQAVKDVLAKGGQGPSASAGSYNAGK